MPPRLTPKIEGVTAEDVVGFRARLAEAEKQEAIVPATERTVHGHRVIWAPQDGSQTAFLGCPIIEAMVHGNRGGGKSDALLMAFAQHVGRGYGRAWRGVIFRRIYKELADIVAKSQKWFRQIFPEARFNESKFLWAWPTGEVLMFRHMRRPEDYWSYHGQELPFIGFEELTTWADPACYTQMFSCCRSSDPNVPRMIRATTNPYGVGHGWVRERFRLHGQWWKTTIVDDDRDAKGRTLPPRVAIYSSLDENKILLAADPSYRANISAAAINESQAKAWIVGSWDIVAGGMFSDVWLADANIVPEFAIPHSWKIDRSFDWGSSKPFSVQWWAQSDGSDLMFPDGRIKPTVRGDLFLVQEWYGFTGRPNEGLRMLAIDVARGIVEREIGWKIHGRVKAGPADSSIYTVENGRSISNDMEQPVRIGDQVYPGVGWTHADKSPGSRKRGWEQMRAMIRSARPERPGLPRERPGLFVVGERCPQFLRTVVPAPRDEKDLDDIATESEDHASDSARYRVLAAGAVVRSGRSVGMY